MNASDAIVKVLSQHPLRQVEALLRLQGRPLAALLSRRYLPLREANASLDSLEIQELVSEQETVMRLAAKVWDLLDNAERQVVLSVCRNLGGDPEDLSEDLALRLAPEQPAPDQLSLLTAPI